MAKVLLCERDPGSQIIGKVKTMRDNNCTLVSNLLTIRLETNVSKVCCNFNTQFEYCLEWLIFKMSSLGLKQLAWLSSTSFCLQHTCIHVVGQIRSQVESVFT